MTQRNDTLAEEADPQIEYAQGIETIVIDIRGRELGRLKDVALTPPRGAIIELGDPNRDAVVLDVRLAIRGSGIWLALVYVQVLDQTVPPPLF